MSLTSSRTNRWASRMIVILQLASWNAVGIVFLHRGVSTLRRRILEDSYVAETDPSTVDLESVLSSTRRNGISEYDLSTQRQSIDRNVEIIIRIDQDGLSSRDGGNLSAEPRDRTFEIVSEEQQRSKLFQADHRDVSTTVRAAPSPQWLENHLTNKISRIARDREQILDKGISRNTINLISDQSLESGTAPSISTKEEEEDEDEEDFAGNATRATVRETTHYDEETNRNRFAFWTGKSNVRLSRANEDGATTAIALVAVGAIMLLVGPIVIVLRILDERRQARKLTALSGSAREDLPPTYEQAVLMDEAPRYSTLTLNYDHTPPSSPNLSSTLRLLERRDVVVS